MYIVIICSIIALLLTYSEASGRTPNGMKYGFVIVTIIACLHYNYGNDYMNYYDIYKSISSQTFSWDIFSDSQIYGEPGWLFINYLSKYIGGFFVLVAILNLFQNILIYKFIKTEVNQQWWPLSVFIYLFSCSLYLLNFSMMRQGFVVCIFIGLWPYIKARKWWIPLIVLYLCSFIHTSSLILIPFSFLGFLPAKKPKLLFLFFLALFILLWVSKDFINQIYSIAISLEKFNEYADTYQDNDGIVSYGIGFIMNLLPLILMLYYLISAKNATDDDRRLIFISAISYIITPFGSINPMVGRLSMYFGAYGLAAIPKVYSNISSGLLRIGLLSIYIVMRLYDYIRFFSDPIWSEQYSQFHTIFEAL